MVFVVNNTMKLSSKPTNEAELNENSNNYNILSISSIPKSPSFHSGLDLVANNKDFDLLEFDFPSVATTASVGSLDIYSNLNINMNGNNQKETATSAESSALNQQQQTIFSFSKVIFIATN